MKKMSLLKVFESIFHPALPDGSNAHMFTQNHTKGPVEFPYTSTEETLDEDDIRKELKLEFKTGRVMKDPLNLPNHNLHNGSFANGAGSKSFANYQLNTPGVHGNDPSIDDAATETMDQQSPEKNGDIPDEWKPYFENRKRSFEQANAAKPKKRDKNSLTLWGAAKSNKIKNETSVGMREKGRVYGAPISTKQPFANGVAKQTDTEFWSDDEIDKELGLKEYISSRTILNRKAHSPEADLNFFEDMDNVFQMNSEEEFEKNQKKRTNEKKNSG